MNILLLLQKLPHLLPQRLALCIRRFQQILAFRESVVRVGHFGHLGVHGVELVGKPLREGERMLVTIIE